MAFHAVPSFYLARQSRNQRGLMTKEAFTLHDGWFSNSQRKVNALKRLILQYSERITGVISCFDRILFKGYLPLGWGDAMEGFLAQQGLKIKDFGSFVQRQSQRLAEHAEGLANDPTGPTSTSTVRSVRKISPKTSPAAKASRKDSSASCELSSLVKASR